jgi:hypothetical protein
MQQLKSLKARIRLLMFKHIWILDKLLSKWLIRISYFLKCSRWFAEHKIPFFEGGRIAFYDYLIRSEQLEKNPFAYLEFGVSKGGSFMYWLDHCKNNSTEFVGFDTFEGIPEDWGSVKAGAYSAGGNIPETNDRRANFQIGLFNETLPPFLVNNTLEKRLVIHLDADLYSSTLYVLINLHSRFKKDDILIFDEFFSVTKADHEFRAFLDYLSICKHEFIAIAKAPNQFAIKLL